MNTARPPNRPCAAQQAPRRAVRAFTLVELTVVVVVIAITGAIALPRYTASLSRYRVDLASKRLAADLALAQSTARAKGAFQSVTLDSTTSRYGLPEQASLAASGRYVVVLADAPFYTTIKSAVDSGARAVTSIKFDGFGRPDTSLTVTLISGDHARVVTVAAESGAINVTTP